MVALVENDYVDVLFAGNALATHDIEASMFGTSLGMDLAKGAGVEHGHEHHIRAINKIRGAGSIANAVADGTLTGGVMHALVRADKPFVLVGSVRDDGPLPDVYTDVVEGQRAMRGPARRRRLRDHGGDDAALDRDRQHHAGDHPARLRRHQPGNGDQAVRPRLRRKPLAWSPTSACSSNSSPWNSSRPSPTVVTLRDRRHQLAGQLYDSLTVVREAAASTLLPRGGLVAASRYA